MDESVDGLDIYLGPYKYSNVDPRCKAKVEAAGHKPPPLSPLSLLPTQPLVKFSFFPPFALTFP
jgi:hypothetical protein